MCTAVVPIITSIVGCENPSSWFSSKIIQLQMQERMKWNHIMYVTYLKSRKWTKVLFLPTTSSHHITFSFSCAHFQFNHSRKSIFFLEKPSWVGRDVGSSALGEDMYSCQFPVSAPLITKSNGLPTKSYEYSTPGATSLTPFLVWLMHIQSVGK